MPPKGSLTVSLSLPGSQQLVQLLPDSLEFTSTDWGIPQYVTLLQGEWYHT